MIMVNTPIHVDGKYTIILDYRTYMIVLEGKVKDVCLEIQAELDKDHKLITMEMEKDKQKRK